MTEYDRASERPLAFDRRAAERPRGGPAPVTLILSLLVLLGVGGGVFYLYRGGLRAPGGAPEPVGAPVGDVKIVAPPQAQAPDPAAGLTSYKQDPNAAAGPAFTAPPEQPTPRPTEAAAPPPVAVLYPVTPAPAAATPATPVTAKPLSNVPAVEAINPSEPPPAKHAKAPSIDSLLADSATVAKAKPVKLASADTTAAPKAKHADDEATPAKAKSAKDADKAGSAKVKDADKVAAAKTKTAKDADKPATTKAKAADAKTAPDTGKHGGFVVQIGAFSSQALADKGWAQAAGVAPGAMAGKGKRVAQVTKDGAVLYRTAITGFDNRADAQAVCAKLAAAGRTCFVR